MDYYQVMIIKTLSEPNKKSFWSAVSWTAFILFFSFKAPVAVNPKYIFQYQDKVVHFMFYFVFVFLWYRFLVYKNEGGFKNLSLIAIVAIALGGCIEVAQDAFTQNRHAELSDFFANTIGAIFGLLFSNRFLKKENQ